MTKEQAKTGYANAAKLLGKEILTRREFVRESGIAKNQINRLFGSYGEFRAECLGNSENWGEELEFSGDVTYNKTSDCYIIFLTKLGKNVVFRGEVIRDIQRNYSDLLGEPATLSDLCRAHSIPRYILTELIKKLGITHSELPLTDQEIEDKTVDEISTDILELKKFKIVQDFNKKDWATTSQDARKWQEFVSKRFDPFVSFIENWTPPEFKPYEVVKQKTQDGYSFIVILNDLHYGSRANGSRMFRGKDQCTQDIVDGIKKYGTEIIRDLKEQNLKINKIIVVSLGDILHTANPFGTTTKGTPLRYDVLNEEMFQIAFDSLAELIYNLSVVVPEIEVYSYKGNHFGTGDSILFFALSKFFHPQKNIKFNICSSFAGSFVEKNTFFVCSHGAADSFKAKAPRNPKIETYIQSLIIHSQENLKGIKSRVALFADLHHINIKEFNDFLYILAPSMVRGDEFSDSLNLDSRPAQLCLLLDDNGIKASYNYYFD